MSALFLAVSLLQPVFAAAHPAPVPRPPSGAVLLQAKTLAQPAQCGDDPSADARLNAQGRSRAQTALARLGYSPGAVDGIFGRRTRAAIRRWQTAIGCPATGVLTQEQFIMLRDTAGSEASGPRLPARKAPQTTPPAPAPQTPGTAGPEMPAKPAPAPVPVPSDSTAQAQEKRLQLSELDRIRVEKLLADLGRNPGKADGVFDADTRAAIAEQQKLWGFPVSGYLDEVTFVRMLSLGILG